MDVVISIGFASLINGARLLPNGSHETNSGVKISSFPYENGVIVSMADFESADNGANPFSCASTAPRCSFFSLIFHFQYPFSHGRSWRQTWPAPSKG